MPLSEEKKPKKQHNIIMENREKLTFSGVIDVDSFDENSVVAGTSCGEMTIEGAGLHIGALDIDRGFLSLDGDISGIFYLEDPHIGGGRKKRGLFGR